MLKKLLNLKINESIVKNSKINTYQLPILVVFFVLLICIISLYQDWDEISLDEKDAFEVGYLYFESDSCLQRVELIDNYVHFKEYIEKYRKINKELSEGVILNGGFSVAIDPFEKVYFYKIDTVENDSILYAKVSQNYRHGNNYSTIVGFVPYQFIKKSKPDFKVHFCEVYLNRSWQSVYGKRSSPHPYVDLK